MVVRNTGKAISFLLTQGNKQVSEPGLQSTLLANEPQIFPSPAVGYRDLKGQVVICIKMNLAKEISACVMCWEKTIPWFAQENS